MNHWTEHEFLPGWPQQAILEIMPVADGATTDVKFIDTIDIDDPEYQKQLMRPAEIKEDVKLMEQRKRVSLILNSAEFRNELEDVVKAQRSSGFAHNDSFAALKQLSDVLVPSMTNGGLIPVNDFRGQDAAVYSKSERLLRCKLASLYRLADISGWNADIYNHITARIDRDCEQFLINPFGLLHSEITASNLIKINMKGDILDNGSTHLGVDREGWFLNSAIHSARNDIRVVLHLHSPAAVAVSGMRDGMLPINNEAMMFGKKVPIYSSDMASLDGSETEDEADKKEFEAITRLIKPDTRALISKANGIYLFAESIEAAWFFGFLAWHTCEVQVCLSPVSLDQLLTPSDDLIESVFNANGSKDRAVNQTATHTWDVGEMEFEAEMRKLDAQGYRTGYMFRQSNLHHDHTRNRSNEDVEIPPVSYSFATDTDKTDAAITSETKLQKRTHWFNTPNSYHKEEIDEIGTPYPKKITRWIADIGDEHQTSGRAVSIANPNQFAPQGGNPKEFRENQRKVKDRYYKDTTTAGPQSKLLEGVTYDEAMKMHEEGVSKAGGPGEHVVVVGAASKGIIQRDVRHNMVVYQNIYTANPFDRITDEELDKYKDDVRKKTDPAYAIELEAEEREVAAREAASNATTVSIHHNILEAKVMAPLAAATATLPIVEVDEYDHHHDAVKAKIMAPQAAEAPSRPTQPIQRAESERVSDQRSHGDPPSSSAGHKSGHHHHHKKDPKPSDTSGAEVGRDTDKEDKDAKEKKKKRKLKLPSFRKSKDKK